jgi:hypothetical protein
MYRKSLAYFWQSLEVMSCERCEEGILMSIDGWLGSGCF